MTFVLDLALLAVLVGALWNAIGANVRANEILRRYEKPLPPPPIKFEAPAKGPWAYFANEIHPRKFETLP